LAGAFQQITAMMKAEPRISDAILTDQGMAWSEHDLGVFEGAERFFRSGYIANLVDHWIPALDGVEAKLKAGETVADVGCRHGASTIIMAPAYPNSRFYGFDNHPPSIERSCEAATQAGVSDRATFEACDATAFPGTGYDLIDFFDCLHDLPEPVGAAKQAHAALAPDGTVLVVEPMAGDAVAENLNPVGRIFSAASVLLCTPHALTSSDTALGTIATEAELHRVMPSGGFSRFRRGTATPFNRVFEIRR
jgi:SAM-dependent methyltransferase